MNNLTGNETFPQEYLDQSYYGLDMISKCKLRFKVISSKKVFTSATGDLEATGGDQEKNESKEMIEISRMKNEWIREGLRK